MLSGLWLRWERCASISISLKSIVPPLASLLLCWVQMVEARTWLWLDICLCSPLSRSSATFQLLKPVQAKTTSLSLAVLPYFQHWKQKHVSRSTEYSNHVHVWYQAGLKDLNVVLKPNSLCSYPALDGMVYLQRTLTHYACMTQAHTGKRAACYTSVR